MTTEKRAIRTDQAPTPTGPFNQAIRVGNLIYFLSSVGIFVTDGYTVTPISLGKVDDAFVFKLSADGNRLYGIFGATSSLVYLRRGL